MKRGDDSLKFIMRDRMFKSALYSQFGLIVIWSVAWKDHKLIPIIYDNLQEEHRAKFDEHVMTRYVKK